MKKSCPSISECIENISTLKKNDISAILIPAGSYSDIDCPGEIDFNLRSKNVVFTSMDGQANFDCGGKQFISFNLDGRLNSSIVFNGLNLTGSSENTGGCINIDQEGDQRLSSVYMYNMTTGPSGCSSELDGGFLQTNVKKVVISNCTLGNNTGSTGGVISAHYADVFVSNSSFINNTATYNFGGAVIANNLVSHNSSFVNNTALTAGVFYIYGTTEIHNSTFSNNSASFEGLAGVLYCGQNITISNSTFSNSTAGMAGAIFGFNITISNSTFHNNTANGTVEFGFGGSMVALENVTIANTTFELNNATIGGAIFTSAHTFSMINSTMKHNNATSGGAISFRNLDLTVNVTISNSTFHNNTASYEGGAIYLEKSELFNLNFTGSLFNNNSASVAGSVYFASAPLTFIGGIFINSNSSESNFKTFSSSSLKNVNIANFTNTDLPTYNVPIFHDPNSTYWRAYGVQSQCNYGFATITSDVDKKKQCTWCAKCGEIRGVKRMKNKKGGYVSLHPDEYDAEEGVREEKTYDVSKNNSSRLEFHEVEIEELNSSSSTTQVCSSFEIDNEFCEKLIDADQTYLKNLRLDPSWSNRLESKFKTDLQNGLSREEVTNGFEERRRIFGRNELPKLKERTFFSFFLESFKDHTLILLSISAIVSLIIGIIWRSDTNGWVESISIIFAVVIVVTVTSLNNYSKEKQFRKLNSKRDYRNVKVIRSGTQLEIDVHELNVGDILMIESGTILPADGILIDGYNVTCEESSLTGESAAIHKVVSGNGDVRMLSGAKVTEGYGRMLVVCIGEHSIQGKTMMSLRGEDQKTPLEEKLDKLADTIGKIGLSIAIATFLILALKLIILNIIHHRPFNSDFVNLLMGYFITSITIVVVVVPEGLPLAVTIALAYSMLKMLKDNNLVRKLEACETMGSVTTICSDKTGTLTENKMSVVAGLVMGIKMREEIGGIDTAKLSDTISFSQRELLLESIAINSTAFEHYDPVTELTTLVGNQTECALVAFGSKLGIDLVGSRKKYKLETLIPFSSTTKTMTTIVVLPDGKYRLFIKGAPELIINRCVQIFGTKIITEMKPEKKAKLLAFVKSMSVDCLRTISLAYIDVNSKPDDWNQFQPNNLILLGVFGIRDPVRKDVPEAVRISQGAGMTVRMITGDNLDTARNIAKKVGILKENGICLEGAQFRNLNQFEMEQMLPYIQVIARSSPMDKHLFVQKLKEMGEIVAVTGDGTNDAPSLKLADVGFSMGICGTEIAKEASDIILMDDNFSSIVNSIKWGRNVMESIQKFLQFQLTVNIVAVFISFIGSISNENGISPLTAIQLLWINLIMDTFASLALATEKPRDDVLKRKSYGKNSKLITRTMWYNIIGQALYQNINQFYTTLIQLTVLLILVFVGADIFGIKANGVHHFTIIFNTFVFLQIFNEINCRRIDNKTRNVFQGILQNWQFLTIMSITIVVQFILVEFGGEFIKTQKLSLLEWVACIGLGSIGLPIGFCIKSFTMKLFKRKKLVSQAKATPQKRWRKVINNTRLQIRIVSKMKRLAAMKNKQRDNIELQCTEVVDPNLKAPLLPGTPNR
ncbi:hypothetical protein PPL_06017 [Heterostelium album PN500]|uniref:Calcium-transporting ATPase n=1 Tax=Heterostelium pallidum (strain ATCC 26659 / Pp 5 / PN500) TaxID=670386 RepID=D3BBZ7_HETP5|nr:hypothetical protein PPL_06017 [Heterostelium album PN500]EFA81180.1 hypothetical protein PPL_06017 [Heterostelium album PN500]|eukprot:XP_020433298.1 hypothetical protein PPL_06017 [Heterostelium album PN500]